MSGFPLQLHVLACTESSTADARLNVIMEPLIPQLQTSPTFSQMMTWISEHDARWWFNEAGIVLEIIGAILLVVSAFRSRARIKDVPNTADSDLIERLREIVVNQPSSELAGFVLLAIGLLGQLAAGF